MASLLQGVLNGAKNQRKERVINTFVYNPDMHIPLEEANHRVDASVRVLEDVKVQSFFLHMHVRGRAMEYRVTYPTTSQRRAQMRYL
jgi:hypothetical protein